MKVIILYTPAAPHRHEVEEMSRQLQIRQISPERVDADSPEGQRITTLYDVPARPTVLVVTDDGQMVQMWQHIMPTVSDVAYHLGMRA